MSVQSVMRLIEQGGPVVIAIFALSLLAWGLIGAKLFRLISEWRGGQQWGEHVIDRLRSGRRSEALALVARQPTILARLMQTAIATDEPRRSFFERHITPFFEAEADDLTRHMHLIAAIGTLSTLLGLLGTVLGMIATFKAMTGQHGGVDAEQMAGGISEALIATQAGLIVAIPVVFMHRWLTSRITRHIDAAALLLKKIETIRCID
jgi:biopolymer transport protein ExbB